MPKTIYYTYCLVFILTGQRYYGVRYAKGCQPGDLWESYFTSSEVINRLIEEHGKEAFTTQIRKTFTTANKAREWEHRVLRRLDVANNPKWLNQTSGKAFPFYIGENHPRFGTKHTPAARQKNSAAHMGIALSATHKANIGKSQLGIALSPEHRASISKANKGKIRTPEQCINLSKAHEKYKYTIQHPDTTILTTTNMRKFCRDNNLNQGGMAGVATGKKKHHKGFRVLYQEKL